ncbi:hypothetical protein SAMN04488529_102225 [Clostridium gasigenes]|uniref:Uncharacterized protein n=1 Tax=Clostridium gasigenes TaxID=94869 RepID=A0A1H0Q7T6_9CLOT|nr:hypothetical protein SAMN04488529_102225 [Clostridium gasigenes]
MIYLNKEKVGGEQVLINKNTSLYAVVLSHVNGQEIIFSNLKESNTALL